MKQTIWICAAAAALCGSVLSAGDSKVDVERELVAMERQAMDGWRIGNPDPVIANLDEGITYIHAMTNGRLDGLPAVKALFERFRGVPLFDSYEIAGPKAQVNGDTAVLTYVLVSRNSAGTTRWNGTQVYQRKKEGWRVIHSHWSQIKES
jgi:hypothetical protein